jgi:hypothetical protein
VTDVRGGQKKRTQLSTTTMPLRLRAITILASILLALADSDELIEPKSAQFLLNDYGSHDIRMAKFVGMSMEQFDRLTEAGLSAVHVIHKLQKSTFSKSYSKAAATVSIGAR